MNLLLGLVTGLLVGWGTLRLIDPGSRLNRRMTLLVASLAAGVSSSLLPMFDASNPGGALSMPGLVFAAAAAIGFILLIGLLSRRYGLD